MKIIYLYLFLFLANSLYVHAAVQEIHCPTGKELQAWAPQRISQNQLRFWFGGVHDKWTPMYMGATMSIPIAIDAIKVLPILAVFLMTLVKDPGSQDWIISCEYKEVGAYGSNINNKPVTTLTLPYNQYKSCYLRNQKVYCES